MKVFTTPIVKGILRGTFHIFEITLCLFLMLFQFIFMTTTFTMLVFSDIDGSTFKDYYQSIVLSIQILTMDSTSTRNRRLEESLPQQVR